MKDRTLSDVRPPGHFLKREIDARGWTQADLSQILGRPPRLVSEIISGKRGITPETAKALGEALATGAEIWMSLEIAYQLSQASEPDKAISRRAQILGTYPVRAMQKRGWLPYSADLGDIDKYLRAFFDVRDLGADINIAHKAKKTSYDKPSAQQEAWLMRARHLASNLTVRPYSVDSLQHLSGSLRRCVQDPDDTARVPQLLSDVGIRFLVIEPLPGSKIDAACMWLMDAPLIVASLRYDRHDIFWHALFHEIDHLRHKEERLGAIVESNMMASCSFGETAERRANSFAAATLIPPEELERLIKTMKYSYSESTILEFAKRVSVHPGIVVGQLQHRGILPWSAFSRFRAKVREVLTKTTLTDGFGISQRLAD